MAKATTASATAAEKDAEKVQAVENTTTEEKAVKTANTQLETVKLIYIGPNLPKAMLPCNKIFEGTDKEIEEELSFIIRSEERRVGKKNAGSYFRTGRQERQGEDNRECIQQVLFRLKGCRPCIRRTGGITNE